MRRANRAYQVKAPFLSDVVIEDANFRYPYWLSADGAALWGGQGGQVIQSLDDWVTRADVGSALPRTVVGVRELANGELLASTTNSIGDEAPGRVYRTTGYDRDNPSAAVWSQVLEAGGIAARIPGSWGMSVHGSTVLLSEYGQWGENGARRVYLSADHAATVAEIFDVLATPDTVTGAPTIVPANAHVHGSTYDPYADRIWVCVGDGSNTATYYSDDAGSTWALVPGSEDWQAVSVYALENRVILGSDAAPNGVWQIANRASPSITSLLAFDDIASITHIGQMPYRRAGHPLILPFTWQRTELGAGVVSMMMDDDPRIVWHDTDKYLGPSKGLDVALGPTASGLLIGLKRDDNQSSSSVFRAAFPDWA